MRRSLPILVLALAIAFAPAVPASAGGSWLYPDRGAYVPGDLARLHGSFSKNGALEGTLADGPYVAYLLPEGRWIERTRIPAEAVRLGELRFVRREGLMRAVVTFTVPDVPTGWYHAGYCNDPCTVDGIGDLIGSWRFVVAPTRLEGQRIRQIDRLELRIESALRKAHAHTRVERQKLERKLEASTAELGDARLRIAALEANLAHARERPGARPLVPGWGVAMLIAAVILAAFVVRRGRAPKIEVPDTVPDELLEHEPVGTR